LGWCIRGDDYALDRTTFLAISMCIPLTSANAERKLALVVGVSTYANGWDPLPNSRRDAELVAEALKRVGFTLLGEGPLFDLERAKLGDLITELGTRSKKGDIIVFYFSGHGVAASAQNLLIPAKVPVGPSSEALAFHSVNLGFALSALRNSQADIKVMLIDACRDAAYAFRDGFEGESNTNNVVISFAAQPFASAAPSTREDHNHSPYANALSSYLKVPGLEIYTLLNEVGLKVMDDTNKMQRPWITGSPIPRATYFNPPLFAQIVADKPLPSESLSGNTEPSTSKSSSYIQKAYVELERSDYAGARSILDDGIRVDPSSALAYSYRGFSLLLEGNSNAENSKSRGDAIGLYKKALSDLSDAIKLDSAYAPAWRHRGNTNLAIYKATRENKQDSKKLKATKESKKSGDGYLADAISDLEQAVKRDPESKRNANALGQAYLAKGFYEKAIESFQNAVKLGNSYAAPYSGLCSSYRMKGDLSAARAYAKEAAGRDDALKSLPCLKKKPLELIVAS
jgi:tetratricopeptide (TPR) repeat protein